ncbi:hypothetical protein AJ79_01977 [Helicocarpus griseus UAMH5409]|uniref:Aminoglycoside phosphotransferase domain-containing protein n=1 Tax=Helicocarpus griseus UAMH5409 TaxID=1447875 RepID=A0A2B7Y5N3_9EURO|nr:hypothetical protein AJ79_01977 [Helicocarpus griseus UAMH5409]
MQLTDMHASNIFVDENWNVKHVIDLEWACSLPLGELQVPFWLTGKGIDQFTDAKYDKFRIEYDKFVDIFEDVEKNASTPLYHNGNICSRAMLMRTALTDRRFWYSNALYTPKGLFNAFRTHLEPLFDNVPREISREVISPFWKSEMSSFVDSKMDEFARYQDEVRNVFEIN